MLAAVFASMLAIFCGVIGLIVYCVRASRRLAPSTFASRIPRTSSSITWHIPKKIMIGNQKSIGISNLR
jgi:heme/copper-type cytochrome/quinol oxidase subunit 2